MQNKLISLVLVVVGIGLLYWGYSESQSVASQVSEAFSGSPQDKVMYKYIGGAVALAVGVYLFVKKG
jgi:nitric oxide reductase large subunit